MALEILKYISIREEAIQTNGGQHVYVEKRLACGRTCFVLQSFVFACMVSASVPCDFESGRHHNLSRHIPSLLSFFQ